MEVRKICVWGDSIAKGVVFDEERGRYAICRDNWLARLHSEAGYDVSNYAVMGSTSEQGLKRMQEQALPQGGLAVIEFGGNDCDLDWAAACEHPEVLQKGRVPLEQFAANLRAMVRKARQSGLTPLLVTPPPLVAKRYFDWVSKNLDPARILNYLGDVEHIYRWQERYALMIAKVAREECVKLLDVRDMFLSLARFNDYMCVDGIHPNARGQSILYDGFSRMLQGI